MHLKLDPLYCNHAVFQAGKIIRIAGQGDGEITVKINGREAVALTKDGRWEAELSPMEYGGPYELTVTDGRESVTVCGIYFGDVFLLAGQSNMQFKVCQGEPPKEGYLHYERIRYFALERIEDDPVYEPHRPKHGWVKCTPEASPYFSSLGYYFAIEYQKKTGRAVGLVACYQGASIIESWMPQAALERANFIYPPEMLFINHTMPAYQAWNKTGLLYDFMFRKTIPYTFSRVLWYQGEANTSELEGQFYTKLLSEMIDTWRADLRDPKLPFTVVQLANLDERNDEGWHSIQRAQLLAGETLPFVHTVVSADISVTDDIHPPKKRPLAKRICEAVLSQNQ